MVRKPTNLSDKRVKVPKDYLYDNVLRGVGNRTEGAPVSETENRQPAGQGCSQYGLPPWLLTRVAHRSAGFPIERDQPTPSEGFLIVSQAASILRISECAGQDKDENWVVLLSI